MKKIAQLLIFIVVCTQLVAMTENVDLTWRLQARNLLVQAKQETKAWLRDREVQHRLRLWLNAEVNRAYVQACEQHLAVYFHSHNNVLK